MMKLERPQRANAPFNQRVTLSGLALAAALGLFAGCGDSNKPGGSAAPSTVASPATAPIPAPKTLPANASPADKAWAAFEQKMQTPPEPPADWATQAPDKDARAAFEKSRGEAAVAVADAARDFYTQFPTDSRAESAHWNELQLLNAAVRLGFTNPLPRLESLEKARIANTASSEDERFNIAMVAAQRSAEMLLPTDEKAAQESMVKSMKAIIAQFPQRPEPYQVLLEAAAYSSADEARATATSLLSTNVPEPIQAAAKSLLAKLDRVGKPLDIKFTAVDGRAVDLSAMKGKVVLIDFWATWCGPCVAELPKVKAAYARLQPQGFEILGISLDQEKDSLTNFLQREAMTWPQFFDGKGWTNEISRSFGIDSIPAMWLVDKNGVLRDQNARDGLESKVAKLLEEPAK
ncbi:MAG: TlpA family protein disulfide reductase [Verrucomicrobiales bacterium]|nr:TlpA family protein disulfide reductase [Verrucomicrobiales bacterium]